MVDLNIELPEGFLDEEVRCDYKVTTEMKQVWAVELDLLQKLLDVCKKNNIQIFADGGTLLGTVRHKCFIPWDDDIDMYIFRDDYEKLCDLADKEFSYPYFFQTEYNDIGTLRGHAQIRNSETTAILKNELDKHYSFNQGIFIDLFPLDYVPEDQTLRAEQRKQIKMYWDQAYHAARNGSRYYVMDENRFKRYARKLYHLFADHHLNKMEIKYYREFEDACKKYLRKSDLVSTISFPGDYGINKVEDYSEIIDMPFEFMTISVPINYDDILTAMYGDYHVFKKNTSVHGDIIFNTDISYKQFFKQLYE